MIVTVFDPVFPAASVAVTVRVFAVSATRSVGIEKFPIPSDVPKADPDHPVITIVAFGSVVPSMESVAAYVV